jgi:hypothetical protein
MLYLGIDQHKSQLTVDLLGEDGSERLKRSKSGVRASLGSERI